MTSFKKYLTPAIVIAVFAFVPALSRAATLSIDPAGGSFVAESTFNVSIFLDTEKEEVNAVDFGLIFPADKLQIVSPSTGFSVVSSWVHQPSFNNQLGRISFQGVMPSGIYAEKGLIATVTFRAKSLGRAVLKFTDNSAVILNDGKGTDVLKGTTNGIYDLVLPRRHGPERQFLKRDGFPQSRPPAPSGAGFALLGLA